MPRLNCMIKNIIFILMLISPASAVFADANGNARLYTFGLTICQASADLISGYAVWLGDVTKKVNDDNVLYPEKFNTNRKLLKELNEKSKDNLYSNLQKSQSSSRASAEIEGLIGEIHGLVSSRAEILGSSEPGMSRIYYQRSLNTFCAEEMASIYKRLP